MQMPKKDMWEKIIDKVKNNPDAMFVKCEKEREHFPSSGKKGCVYFIRRSSIYIDTEGTVYGELYADVDLTCSGGYVRLDRFVSIM